MDVLAMGNFDVTGSTFNADFQHNGWWYELWSGDSINVTNTAMSYTLGAGEYRLYTTTRLPKPNLDFVLDVADGMDHVVGLQIWPNPASDHVQFAYNLSEAGTTVVGLFDLSGRQMRNIPTGFQSTGAHEMAFDLNDLPSGSYILRVQHAAGTFTKPLVIRR